MSISKTLLAEIEKFLDTHGMAPTTFGIQACRDPHIVRWLRDGKGITSRRIDKIREFMRDYSPDGKPRPNRNSRVAEAAA